ncbi:MAG: pyrimidine 5'-nucleotidase [Rhodospirillales bacterium]|nr:pyrimidine 5'-nucleotidase [Rhodospirillales bacterium]
MVNSTQGVSAPSNRFPAGDLGLRDVWLFDLDNTLYSATSNFFAQIDDRMRSFIARELGLGLDEAHTLQKSYFRQHGTTLRGLMDRHGVAPEEFLAYVHDIDLSPLRQDAALDQALSRLPGRKIVFTNGTRVHAERVLDRVGVARRFEAIFDIADAGFRPKPEPVVYAMLVRRHGVDPKRAVMVEDLARNLVPAAAMGMATVWLRTGSSFGAEGSDGDHVHHVTDDLVGWLEGVIART